MLRLAALLAVSALVAGCGESVSGPRPAPGLSIIAQPPTTDTIDASPAQGLVVEVRDSAGQPVEGTTVRFEVLERMSVGDPAVGVGWPLVALPTNARGRATALVRFGFETGVGRIRIVVPELGAEKIFETTVEAGQPARVVVGPADTTLYRDGTVQLRGQVTDRYGNARTDPVSYQVIGTGPPLVSVSAAGVVTAGSSYGIALVRVVAGAHRDSSRVTIVPRGVIAAVGGNFPYSLITSELDGSARQTFQLSPNHDIGLTDPTWLPDGSGIVYVEGNPGGAGFRIMIRGLDGSLNPLISTVVPDLGVQLSPAVSRNGQTVVFSGGNISTGLRTLWKVARDGTGARPVTSALTGGDFHPAIEPAGAVAAFHAPGGIEGEIRFALLSSGSLVGPTIPGLFPEYAGGGDRLSLVTGESLAVVNVDGTGYRIITPAGRRYAMLPAVWSPDDQWLLARGESSLELIQVATGLRLPLSWSTQHTHPAWKPGS